MQNDLLTFLMEFMRERVDAIEAELAAHPDEHAQFTAASTALDAVATNPDAKAQALNDAWMYYSAALALEMYAHGVRDGGRIFDLFLNGRCDRHDKA